MTARDARGAMRLRRGEFFALSRSKHAYQTPRWAAPRRAAERL